MLHPPSNRRERILGYGQSKQGKSTAWLDIAEWLYKTGSKNKVIVGDTDVAWEAMRPMDGHLDHIVKVTDLDEWADYKSWINKAKTSANPDRNDWLVLDMVDKCYETAKGEYFMRRFGKELDEFFIEAKGDTEVIGGAYGTNWDVINKMYNSVMNIVHRFPGHVYCATPADEVRLPAARSGKGGDDEQTRAMFGTMGMKPKGQKLLPHMFHTILYFQKGPRGYMMTTVGERQRKRFTGEIVGVDEGQPLFVAKYLIGAAGWRP